MRAAMAARMTAGAVGVAMLVYGAWHLLNKNDVGPTVSIGKWLVGGVIVHDGILAPVVFAGCALAWRFTGVRFRRGLAVFALAGGSVAIVALPSALRSGDNSNPTVTPLDYPRNLAVVLGGLAVCVALYVLGGRWKDRRRTGSAVAPEPETGPKPGPEPEPVFATVAEHDISPQSDDVEGTADPAQAEDSTEPGESQESGEPAQDDDIETAHDEELDGQG
jgi:hypothetical protein